MIVATVFPSCNLERAMTARDRWREQGYKVAIWVEEPIVIEADLVVEAEQYPGYWRAVNLLARRAVVAGADIVVPIGDDMDPDPKLRADEIASQYRERFPDLFGVMQPVGDDLDGTDRVCGSPWLGKGWVERANNGTGPLWHEYQHYYGDEELQNVALKLGVLWQRPDLCHYHHHWVGGREPIQSYQTANSTRWWEHDKALFMMRQAQQFPKSDPLPVIADPRAKYFGNVDWRPAPVRLT